VLRGVTSSIAVAAAPPECSAAPASRLSRGAKQSGRGVGSTDAELDPKGGRYFKYRPPPGCLKAVRSGFGGPD
jgi:hypothetical protein